MKTLISLLLLLTTTMYSQTSKHVNLNDMSKNVKETLNKGSYLLEIEAYYEVDKYYINYSFDETTVIFDSINIEDLKNNELNTFMSTRNIQYEHFYKVIQFTLVNRSKIEIIIKVFNKSDNTLFKESKIIYKSKNKKKWVTSLGLSSAFLTNSDTYRALKQNDTTNYKVVKDGSNAILKVIPVMQFSFINLEKDSGFTFTGGLGYDTENLSAFFGGSYYVGQNIFITGGFSLHKQQRLNNLYTKNQILNEAIDESLLNKEYYRFNPFISITYRLSSNIFKNNSN